MKYAIIDSDLQIVGHRDIDDPSSIPQHKTLSDGGLLLRPIIYHDNVNDVDDSIIVKDWVVEVTKDKVCYKRVLKRHSRQAQVDAVKNEALARIEKVAPLWKQMNYATAESNIFQKHLGISGSPQITTEDLEFLETLNEIRDQISKIRQASNVLESMDEVPADFRHDRYWT